MIIADESWNIVSDRNGNEGKNLNVTGLHIDTKAMAKGEVFTADVYGESCYCMYKAQEVIPSLPLYPVARWLRHAIWRWL